MNKTLKKSLPYLAAATLFGGLTTWYIKARPKRLKETREIDFQKVTV